MKKFKLIIPIILSMVITLNLTSCFLIVSKDTPRHDNGNHNGWYKTPNKTNKTIIVVPNGQANGHGKH